jgi:hypothetical protein
MDRSEYLKLSLNYFNGQISADELMDELGKGIDFEVDELSLLPDERVMLIANHPRAEEDLSLPAEYIAGLKGGNTKNFPSHWFPAVRQMMLRKVLQRRFFTLAFNIGWSVAMQEMGHLLISSNGKGRCQEIISLMKGDQSSLVIFPEGGVRDLQIFRTGFFHIACELEIRQLVVCAFSPILSLKEKNTLRIIHVEDMSRFIDPVIQFVDAQRERIEEVVRK